MITVALAAYNVENYIEDCLKSILAQTYSDFEFICINDGSTDNTLSILRKYEKMDSRIRIINKEVNEGLAVARNLSIEEAKGDYIWLMDGDDLFNSRLLEDAYQVALKENSDIIMWDYFSFVKEVELKNISSSPYNLLNMAVKDRIALLRTPAFTWVKLYKTSTLKSLKIQFPKGLTRQDIPIHWKLLTSDIKLSILPKKLSYYRQQGGATTAQKNEKLFHLAYVMDIVCKDLINSNKWNEYKDEFLRQQLNLLFGMYDSVRDDLKSDALILIKERLKSDQIEYIELKGSHLRKQAKWFYKSLNSHFISSLKYSGWKLLRTIYRKLK